MLGPNLLSLESIPTLLRQGGIGGESTTTITNNYSIYLDGTSDRLQGINMQNTWLKVMGPNTSFTLMFDIQPEDAGAFTISFTGTGTDYFWIQVDAARDFIVSRYAGGLVYSHRWAANIGSGVQNICLTSDGSGANRTWKLYVRGADMGAESVVTAGPSSTDSRTTGKFTMGTFLNVVDYDFYIDNLISWSAVLTEAEIQALVGQFLDARVDQGVYTSSNRLETYYTMEEGSGSTTSDVSGNGNADLTIINGTVNVWADSILA